MSLESTATEDQVIFNNLPSQVFQWPRLPVWGVNHTMENGDKGKEKGGVEGVEEGGGTRRELVWSYRGISRIRPRPWPRRRLSWQRSSYQIPRQGQRWVAGQSRVQEEGGRRLIRQWGAALFSNDGWAS